MSLTDVKIRQAKPREKPYRMTDGGGLFVEIRPNGAKFWRYAYRIGKKQNLFAIGVYPELSLQAARSEHQRARGLVAQGIHPSHNRAKAKHQTIQQGEETLRAVAEEWFAAKKTTKEKKGWSDTHEKLVRYYLEKDIYPRFGRRPIRSISSAEVLALINEVLKRGPSAAARVRQFISQIFAYAISTLRADNDPTYPLRRAIVMPEVQHADAKDREFLMEMYRRISAYKGNRKTKIALRLLPMLFSRTKELRTGRWRDFDLDGCVWNIPPEFMKKGRRHIVPLPRQAVVLLRELHEITGRGDLLFPNVRDVKRPMSRGAVNRAFERMGYPVGEITGHDFRATASTLLHEVGFQHEVVDIQLAHVKTDKTDAAYNHAKYLPARVKMMQWWADWLDKVEAGTAPSTLQVGAAMMPPSLQMDVAKLAQILKMDAAVLAQLLQENAVGASPTPPAVELPLAA